MVILWFGLYDPEFSRNRIYMRALRERGHTIIECRDTSPGLLKWWRLYKKHKELKGGYDVLVVGYPGHVAVPLARCISRKKVVADLLGSLSDAGEHSHHHNLWHRTKNRLIDWLAVFSAHSVFLESEAQRRYFVQRFGNARKYRVLYTGVDESEFYCAKQRSNRTNEALFVFRGALKPESGVLHILKAAQMLEGNARIRFRIIGTGHFASVARDYISKHKLSSVEFVNERVSFDELRTLMCGATASFGQLESNSRLDRTIPHKAFESMHMELPYISADVPAIREIFENDISALLIPPGDPLALLKAIEKLALDPVFAERLAKRAKSVYNKQYSSDVLSDTLDRILTESSR